MSLSLSRLDPKLKNNLVLALDASSAKSVDEAVVELVTLLSSGWNM